MDTHTTITFDRLEQQTLGRANVHLTLAFPKAGKVMKGTAAEGSADEQARLVYRLGADKTIGTRDNIAKSIEIYEALLAKAERDVTHWQAEADRLRGIVQPDEQAHVVIIPDPVRTAEMLVEIRQGQIRDVQRAIELLTWALEQFPPEHGGQRVLITGSPVDGFEFEGPFSTRGHATRYALWATQDQPWWIVTLTTPQEMPDGFTLNAHPATVVPDEERSE